MNIPLKNKYILPSPAGAYYCISTSESDPAKLFLQQLMIGGKTIKLDSVSLNQLLVDDSSAQEELLLHIQKLKWLQSFEQIEQLPSGTIEQVFPDILGQLSSEGKVLLADGDGFYLSSAGFTHEAAEELSALSGDLSSLYLRHKGVISGNLNIKSSAFSLVDAAGHSQLGFWPLYIGDLVFMLVISGVPRFDQNAFVNLVWSLHKRYFINKIPADSVTV